MRNYLAAASAALILAACRDNPVDTATLHDRLLTLDTHVDIPLDYMLEVDPATETDLQVDFAKMRDGGLDAAFFIVYTPQTPVSEAGYASAREIAETRYQAIRKMVETYPETIALARTADDVERIEGEGKLAALIGMENAYPLGPSIDDVPMWADRGVRYVGLTHFGVNQFGDSSNLKPYEDESALTTYGGLSPLGRDLVVALNDHGILVDVSHTGDQTALQAIELSRVPVIASHSGVDGINDHPRNMSDELLEALSDNGGVVQLVALGSYVRAFSAQQFQAAEALRARRDEMSEEDYDAAYEKVLDLGERASLSDYVDHIEYAVDRAGIDHVGIASDFDGGGGIVGWQDASETQALTEELLARGYTRDDIAKIWGGNVLRIMRAAEEGAR